jgi:hypothetical protein
MSLKQNCNKCNGATFEILHSVVVGSLEETKTIWQLVKCYHCSSLDVIRYEQREENDSNYSLYL